METAESAHAEAIDQTEDISVAATAMANVDSIQTQMTPEQD